MINLQSYNEVLDFLELFFQKYILDSNCLQDMQSILDDCRKDKMVAIRAIDSFFMEYRRKLKIIESLLMRNRKYGSSCSMYGNKTLNK